MQNLIDNGFIHHNPNGRSADYRLGFTLKGREAVDFLADHSRDPAAMKGAGVCRNDAIILLAFAAGRANSPAAQNAYANALNALA